MTVKGIAMDFASRDPIILLIDKYGKRQVPILIDHAQANNILTSAEQSHRKRPQSHDLIVSLMSVGNLQLERVIIHTDEQNEFQAVLKLLIKGIKGKRKSSAIDSFEIHALPSDAIALALHFKSSIWMCEELLASKSIPVDSQADEEERYQFKQFLKSLNPSDLINHLDSKHHSKEGPFDFPNSN